MERDLINAAKEGSVQKLLELLDQDEFIVHKYISRCFKEKPLHIATMYGHLEFITAVLTRMPEMVKELDSGKSTPLHVATAHGHIQVVKELLSVNPDMCYAKDCGGRNPAHVAVIKGHIDILKELFQLRPQAVQDAVGASTILHLCIKHYQLEALKYVLQVIPNDVEFVNSKDEEGFTILHSAVAEKQTEVVKFLLHEHRKVDMNATNAYGFTAWDICLAQGRKNVKDIEIAECFRQTGELGAISATGSRFRSEDIIRSDSSAKAVADSNSSDKKIITRVKNFLFSRPHESKSEKKKRLEESCNTLMIVATIIATFTFQAALQPPDKIEEPANFDSSDTFLLFNTFSFSIAIFVILLLISGLPLRCRLFIWILRITMWFAVLSSAFAYVFAMEILTRLIPYPTEEARVSNEAFLALAVGLFAIILTVGHAIRIIFKMVRCFLVWMKEKRRGNANSNAQGHCCV